MDKRCSILIMARDSSIRQAKLTGIFIKKYWEDCPYDIWLCTQTKSTDDDWYENVIYTDPDMIWGKRLEEALKHIKSEFVLLCPEDDFLTDYVSNSMFASCIDYALENDVSAIRMAPPMLFSLSYKDGYRIIPLDSIYRVVLHPMLFKREFLEGLASRHYSPWQFEREGSRFSSESGATVLCVTNPVYNTVHAWSTGKWTREGYAFLEKEDIQEGLYNFASQQSIFVRIKEYVYIVVIKIVPHLINNIRIKQCARNERKLRT